MRLFSYLCSCAAAADVSLHHRQLILLGAVDSSIYRAAASVCSVTTTEIEDDVDGAYD